MPMWVFDRETLRFLEVNQAALAHYGYTRDEFLSMTVADVRHADDVAQLSDVVNESNGPTPASQGQHKVKDGRLIAVEVVTHTISYGGRAAVLAVLQDVTQRKMLEEQVRQSAKMEAVGMLAGGIAHDFNNLLTIINGYSHILLNVLAETDPNRGAVEQIMKAGERAASLTGQLLAYSRKQVLQPKVLNLNQVLSGMEAMLRRLIGEHIELCFVPGKGIGQVKANAGQIEQVVMNLAVNGRDAMPGGGTLTLETRNVEIDRQFAAAHSGVKPGRYVALMVDDSGSGMSAETRSHLFEPFFTTKAPGQGTGLGLATVFGIVKQSGGSVDVSSKPGKGTTVNVYLPRIDETAMRETQSAQVTGARGSETILLVEDEESVRNLVRETLRRQGYTVLAAADAAAARRIGKQHKGEIHLLITDVVMPKVGGREVAARLAQQRPAMKVLFMSGYTEQVGVDSLPGQASFIQKPFTPVALGNKVREVLGGNGQSHRTAGS